MGRGAQLLLRVQGLALDGEQNGDTLTRSCRVHSASCERRALPPASPEESAPSAKWVQAGPSLNVLISFHPHKHAEASLLFSPFHRPGH